MSEDHIAFFRELLAKSDNISAYVDSLYKGNEYSEEDLNHLFGVLKREGLITCDYYSNRAWVRSITFEGKHFFDKEDQKKPRIVTLIDQIDEIEGRFHKHGLPEVDYIHDVQEFQNWLQEVIFELTQLYHRTNETFAWETLNLLQTKMNGWNDKQVFSVIKAKLLAIKRNIGTYISDGTESQVATSNKEREKRVKNGFKVFISHSSKDVAYVTHIVDLLDAMGLNQTQVFCSSLPGYDIPIDTTIFDYLRQQFSEYDLHVIFVHSKNYYESPVSLNEMGAAWALQDAVTSILLPGFGFKQMTGVVNDTSIAIKMDKPELEVKDKLNQLYAKIVKEFNLTKKADIIWEQKRNNFINEMKQVSVKEDASTDLSEAATKLLMAATEDESGLVIKDSDMTNGTLIKGGSTVMNEHAGQRESAKWIAALEELLKAGFISASDEKGQVYRVTDAGYKHIDGLQTH